LVLPRAHFALHSDCVAKVNKLQMWPGYRYGKEK